MLVVHLTTNDYRLLGYQSMFTEDLLVYENERSLKFIDAIDVRPIGGDSPKSLLQQKARILELKSRYFKDYYSEDQYAVPSRKIRRIRACTHQSPQRNKAQYAVSREDQYTVLEIWNEYNILEDIKRVRMTKVIKGEFEKSKDVKVEDVLLTYDTPLEVFNNEVNRLSRMDDDLFTYEIDVANIPCDSKMDDDSEHEADDDMRYDPFDVAFTKWLGSKLFNCKTMDYYTMKALWIYWVRGDDEVELTDEESSDDKDEVAKTYLLRTLRDSRPIKITRMIGSMNGTRTYHGWKDNGYCNGGNLLGTYIIGNQLHYQSYEWYEALEESELKDEALRNKAIMEGFINEGDDESRYEQERRWNIYTNYDDAYEINHEDNEKEELCEVHELPVYNIRRYMMIKYSFNNDEEYVAVNEDEYDDPTITREEACRAYQEIF
ncbi:hypothetical protein Tco_0266948 [Tanacetum coccineum]